MTSPPIELGSGMALVPELLLRRVLLDGIVELVGDEHRMREIVRRHDTGPGVSVDRWERDLRAGIATLAQSTPEGTPAQIMLGYPVDHAVYPAVSIVLASGGEDEHQATTGDRAPSNFEQRGNPTPTDWLSARSIEHEPVAIGWSSQVQVGVWALAPEQSVLLHAVVKSVLLRERGRLAQAGVTAFSMTETGFEPGEGWPRVGFVPALRLSLGWTMITTRRHGPVPTRVRVYPVIGDTT